MHTLAVDLMWLAVIALPALPALAWGLSAWADRRAAERAEAIRQRTGALRKRRAF